MKGIESFKTDKNYTTEELFEQIKDCNFTAGKPEFKETGILKYIKLPAVGHYCIQIAAGGKKIQLSMVEDMGQTGNFVANSMARGALGVFAKALDNDKKPSLEVLEKTTAELKGFLGV